MTVKIHDLINRLKRAGFIDRGGKGSHRNFIHRSGVILTLSGKPGDDAKPYQMKLVKEKIEESSDESK
ncbi:MAG: type II toxin-antitoxin system HicA family toxin [Candidatus Aminicenantes bacterium]|nr:type II toxin-antitoxin system HicA family toxin [Candidatus Aminicenantes bacterium]